jgi:glycosyltransferase involved in cell wall biosynthesis
MRVLSMIDSLIAAGAERMAVNIANGLADAGVESYLCATRESGPLAEFVKDPSKLFILGKKQRFDGISLIRLIRFVRRNRIQIIHAHSSSVFWAVMVKLFLPRIKIVWHDHFGFSDFLHQRDKTGLKLVQPFVGHAFVVNTLLQEYAIQTLGYAPDKVSYLRNFPVMDFSEKPGDPGIIPNAGSGPRFICLANIRPQKDHFTLLEAFQIVRQQYPDAQLYLVGGDKKDDYLESVNQVIETMNQTQQSVHLMGSRNDVSDILTCMDVGVLSSISEGLPVSLLEYGLAGLPVVSTKVGECVEVLEAGRVGLLVEPKDARALAESMIMLAGKGETVSVMANAFREKVKREYSQQSAIETIVSVYTKIITR